MRNNHKTYCVFLDVASHPADVRNSGDEWHLRGTDIHGLPGGKPAGRMLQQRGIVTGTSGRRGGGLPALVKERGGGPLCS